MSTHTESRQKHKESCGSARYSCFQLSSPSWAAAPWSSCLPHPPRASPDPLSASWRCPSPPACLRALREVLQREKQWEGFQKTNSILNLLQLTRYDWTVSQHFKQWSYLCWSVNALTVIILHDEVSSSLVNWIHQLFHRIPAFPLEPVTVISFSSSRVAGWWWC